MLRGRKNGTIIEVVKEEIVKENNKKVMRIILKLNVYYGNFYNSMLP